MAQTRHIMKKIFLGLALLLVSTGAIFAQSSLLATLSHEGEITVFYGPDALEEAHAAATHGDVISLSAGKFYSVDITKAITLRGAGTVTDVEKNIHPTNIIGGFNIDIEEGVTQSLTIEGIYTKYDIKINSGLENAYFLKNRFNSIEFTNDTALCKNNYFINCKILYGFYTKYNSGHNSIFVINSYINYLENKSNTVFKNSIIMDYGYYQSSSTSPSGMFNLNIHCTFHNCILIGGKHSGGGDYLDVTCDAYNCIATNLATEQPSYGKKFFVNITHGGNWYIYDISKVFKTATPSSYGTNGIISIDTETFELLDEVKTKYLGTDSTQVGIYGGPYPYSPVTTSPQITKCNVSSRTTADGKLSIEIEVKAGE